MISILNVIIFTSIFTLAIIVVMLTSFENVIAQIDTDESQSYSIETPVDNNNDGMIISEVICPPYCRPPPLIQELSQCELP